MKKLDDITKEDILTVIRNRKKKFPTEELYKKQRKSTNRSSSAHFSSNVKSLSSKSNEFDISKLTSLIDRRCRYWVENRISQLLSSDNFTTREGYSFGIDTDRNKPGLCFRFTKNGTTIAKIDSDGILYCSNVFANNTNLLAISRFIEQFNANSAIYVKHVDLKNGTYVMNIDDITTNTVEANVANITTQTSNDITTNVLTVNEHELIYSNEQKPLIIDNDNTNNYVDVAISDGLIRYDKTNERVDIGTNINDTFNNIVSIKSSLVQANTSNVNVFNTNDDATLKIGSNDGNARCFNIYYDYMYDTSNCSCSLGLQGHPALKFWIDRLEALLPLNIDTINATNINTTNITVDNLANIKYLRYLWDAEFYNDTDMFIKFKKLTVNNNDFARLIYNTSGNTLSLDINKNHSILARVYSDSGDFQTLNKSITLLDSNGMTTLNDVSAVNGSFSTSLTVNGQSVLTDDSNYAKLNASNTFTGLLNSFKSIESLSNYMTLLYNNLSAGYETAFNFGKGVQTYEAGNLAYHLDSTLANSYIHLYLNGNSGLKIYADKIESITPFSCPSLTVNGNTIDAANIAYTNKTNTFNKPQEIIQDAVSYNPIPLTMLTYELTNNSQSMIWIGKNQDTDNSATIAYNHDADNSRYNSVSIGFDTIRKVIEFNGYGETKCNGQLTATVDTSNHSLSIENTSLGNNVEMRFLGYESGNQPRFGYISFKPETTMTNSYFNFNVMAYNPMKIYPDRVEITGNSEFPIKAIHQQLSNGTYTKIGITDGSQTAITGLDKDSSGTYSAYYKLNGQSASINVYSNKIKFNGKIETNQTTPNNAFDTNMKAVIRDFIYPVGAIYISYSSTSPATLFGGSWTQITDRFLYCANSSGSTGGSSSHKHSFSIRVPNWYWSVGGILCGNGNGGFNSYYDTGVRQVCNHINVNSNTANETYMYQSDGSTNGTSTMPPYITVYCWRRTG